MHTTEAAALKRDGLQLGLTCLIPSQSARSRALARAVDRPTTRTLLDVWEEMKLVLDTMTSNTGPLSSPGNSSQWGPMLWKLRDSVCVVSCCGLTQQVNLIDNENGHSLNVTAVLPAPAHSIPLLRRGDYQVSLRYGSHVRSHITSQLYHSSCTTNGKCYTLRTWKRCFCYF